MDYSDLSAYYEKLSEIRAKVLNKHREEVVHSCTKYPNENFAETRNRRGEPSKEKNYLDQRRPLGDKQGKEANVMERVKELDCVN